jgi:ubiquinone/menaquinone biosynthesis C-methylase UbiE
MNSTADAKPTRGNVGLVLHSARRYDLLVSLIMFGRENSLREKMLRLARVGPGESVLDVGCGTGTLAIAAKRLAGPTGVVQGVDASPEMLARAEKKARRAGVDVGFREGVAQALPFPDAQFDVVLATMMLHHVPRSAHPQTFAEMRRVLKPGGRVFVVDFAKPGRAGRHLFDFLHRRYGHVDFGEIVSLFNKAGLEVIESDAVGMKDLRFVLASAASE